MTVYGKDAWLHRKNCPWLEYMDLEKGDRVLFQVEINERGIVVQGVSAKRSPPFQPCHLRLA